MKHAEIIRAYAALGRLGKTEIPLETSYRLFKIRKMLRPQWDFQCERMDAILQKYEPRFQMDGSYKFKSQREAEKCVEEMNKAMEEINQMDIDLADIKRPAVKLDTDIRLSMDDIEALADFVDFTE